MIDYLYQTSDLNLFLILISFFIGLSLLALFFIRRFLPLHLRYQENAVIGCTSALVSVIYGVLAGFATLYLINNYNAANDSMEREANAVANMYRDSHGLSDPLKSNIQTAVKNYINQVLNVEWPLMNTGKTVTNTGATILENILNDLTHYQITNLTDSLIVADMLTVSRSIFDARQQRIQLSYTSLSNEVWVVIIIGTVLTLCVSYLFGINFYLHIFVTSAAALMTSSIIFLLISLDKPFQGDTLVGPGMFKAAAVAINNSSG